MMVTQILDYHCRTGARGALVFLDQEKAYDRVDWGYLQKCMVHFGIGPRWRQAVTSILTNFKASVLVNGF